MSDLISRQAAVSRISDLLMIELKGERIPTWNEVYRAIQELPSADKRGKWMPVDSFSAYGGDEITWMVHGNPVAFYYCSECKEQAYVDENGEIILSRFCPDCGAKMERSEE